MGSNSMGPESPRNIAPFVAMDVEIDAIAARLCPRGPRPARDIAADLGCIVAPADLPAEAPVTVHGRTVLFRDDARAERSILEGVAFFALSDAGLDDGPEEVQALIAQLVRPVSVRSASW